MSNQIRPNTYSRHGRWSHPPVADLVKPAGDGHGHSTANAPAHRPCGRRKVELTSTGPVDEPFDELPGPKREMPGNSEFPGISFGGGGRI